MQQKNKTNKQTNKPCLDTYHGTNAFSEPETKAVNEKPASTLTIDQIPSGNLRLYLYTFRDFVMSKRHRLTSYIAFHR